MTSHRMTIPAPRMSQKYSSDKLFPFRKECQTLFRTAFNPIQCSNFEPPSSTLRKLYYSHENEVENHFKTYIANPYSSERHFLRSRSWQSYTQSDMRLDFDFLPLMPNGSRTHRPVRRRKYQRQPFIQKLPYSHLPVKVIDPKKTCFQRVDASESESREFLSHTNSQVIESSMICLIVFLAVRLSI